jgi:hypothetical protein
VRQSLRCIEENVNIQQKLLLFQSAKCYVCSVGFEIFGLEGRLALAEHVTNSCHGYCIAAASIMLTVLLSLGCCALACLRLS